MELEKKSFLTDADLPFCKGCGHNHIAANTEKAYSKSCNAFSIILQLTPKKHYNF